jgi:hypothetical protein
LAANVSEFNLQRDFSSFKEDWKLFWDIFP